jgi:hypothetical protein
VNRVFVCRSVVLAFLVAALTHVSFAQERTYKGRLSPVPLDTTMFSTVAGVGSITATVSGQRITFAGTFSGLRSPATTVNVHRAIRGTRGPVVASLEVTKATSGQISGSIAATPQLLQDLERTMIYVQLQSEKAPDGNLWGWLFLQGKQ